MARRVDVDGPLDRGAQRLGFDCQCWLPARWPPAQGARVYAATCVRMHSL